MFYVVIWLKSTKAGPVAYKSVFCLAYQHGFPNHLKNVDGKVSWRRIRAYIVLYMWGEYFIDILARTSLKKNTNIGHFGYVQFANYGNQCLTVES